MSDAYDLIIIGGGPGGYVAAIRAAQLGLKTACVEKRGALGGTCLNVGCIPSKALLQSSEKYEEAAHEFETHGIDVGDVKLNLKTMMGRKEKVVDDLTKGIEFLFKKNKVDYLKGKGRIDKPGSVVVTAENGGGEQTLETKNILIATGSESMPIPGVDVDEKQVVTSTGALALSKVPKHFVVIGGGYIGLEMGSVWRRLGSKVTVVEFLDRITPGMDGEVSKQFQRVLKKQGMDFRLKTKVTGATTSSDKRDPDRGTVGRRRRGGNRLRRGARLGRPPAVYRGARPRRGGREDRQPRLHRDRRSLPDLDAGHLRHRRLRARPDAGA